MDSITELPERPGTKNRPLLPLGRNPVEYAGEIFHRNTAPGAFSFGKSRARLLTEKYVLGRPLERIVAALLANPADSSRLVRQEKEWKKR